MERKERRDDENGRRGRDINVVHFAVAAADCMARLTRGGGVVRALDEQEVFGVCSLQTRKRTQHVDLEAMYMSACVCVCVCVCVCAEHYCQKR